VQNSGLDNKSQKTWQNHFYCEYIDVDGMNRQFSVPPPPPDRNDQVFYLQQNLGHFKILHLYTCVKTDL